MEQDEQVKHLRHTTGYGERFRLTLTSHVLFGTKMATSFRGVGRKGWSPALEAPPQNSTSRCHRARLYTSSTDLMQRNGYDALGSRCTPLDCGFGLCV